MNLYEDHQFYRLNRVKSTPHACRFQDYSWIHDFEADFSQKVSLKMLNLGDHNSFSDLFSVCVRTIDHLNLKLWIFSGHTASFKIGVSKVQDFGNVAQSFSLIILFQTTKRVLTKPEDALSGIVLKVGEIYLVLQKSRILHLYLYVNKAK